MADSDTLVAGSAFIYLVPDTMVITDATQTLTGATNIGEITTDGITYARSFTAETIKSNNKGTIRTLKTDSEVKIGATLLEDTQVVREFITGALETAGVITDDGKGGYRGALVIDIIDEAYANGDTKVVRLWAPDYEVDETSEQTLNGTTALQYGFSGSCYSSDKIGGGKVRRFTKVLPAGEPAPEPV